MQPPDELMVQAFLPSMRQLVALKLSSRGLSQNRIAGLLGVTQASVSLYLSSGSQKSYSQLSGFALSKEEADDCAIELAEAVTKSTVDGVASLNSIWVKLLGNGSVCQPHRSLYPSLADCDYCIREYGSGRGPQGEAIAEVSDAVRLLEASPAFVSVMPMVSVNVACAAGDASSPAEIVAVPGRIVRVRGRAKAMLAPEAGASIHLSRVLLLVRRVRPEIRACINLRYDGRMETVLKGLGLRILAISSQAHREGTDPTADALGRSLGRPRAPFDVVVDRGGSGVEPNVYIFSKGAREAAVLAVEIAMRYSAS
jgi:XRE family transcriptional regulator, thiamine biosynthesis regulator